MVFAEEMVEVGDQKRTIFLQSNPDETRSLQSIRKPNCQSGFRHRARRLLAIVGTEELIAWPVGLLAKFGAVCTASTTCAGFCWRHLTDDVQGTNVCVKDLVGTP